MKNIISKLFMAMLIFLPILATSNNADKEYYYVIKSNKMSVNYLNCPSGVFWFDLANSSVTDRVGRLKGYNFETGNDNLACRFDIPNVNDRLNGENLLVTSSGFNKGTATALCDNGQWIITSANCNLHCDTNIPSSIRSSGGRTCSFPLTTPIKTPHNETTTFSNTDAGNIGVISYQCNDGLWDFTGFSCSAKQCSGSVTWSQNGNNCTSNISGEDGQISLAVDNDYSPTGSGTGSAQFTCQGYVGSDTGNWVLSGSANCIRSYDGACDNNNFDSCLPDRGTANTFTENPEATVAFWFCSGGGLGNSSNQCSREKNEAITNGVCGINLNSCSSGIVSNSTVVGDNYTWTCNGSNGNRTTKQGTNQNCSLAIPACGSANGQTLATLNNTTNSQTCLRGTISDYISGTSTWGWSCQSADQLVSCSANKNSVCGTANGTITGTVPSTNLCAIGSASTVITNTNTYTWNCTNGTSTSNCSATRTAVCNNGTFQGCSLGTASAYTSSNNNTSTTATWNCVNGISTVGCSRAKTTAVNGSCGSANGQKVQSPPTTNLCNSGTPTSVTTSSSYTWSCNGSTASFTQMGGTSSNCSAPIAAASCNNSVFGGCAAGTSTYTSPIGASTVTWNCVDSPASASCSRAASTGASGSCGSANGTIQPTAPTSNLCSSGYGNTAVTFSAGWYMWNCNGQPATQTSTTGSSVACAATRTAICSSSSFQACDFGIPSGYTSSAGSPTATWNCSNGASVVSCSRSKVAGASGSCGSANGTIQPTTPTSNLCSSGYGNTGVTFSAGWYMWNCNGQPAGDTNLAGSSAACAATRQAICASSGYGTCDFGTPSGLTSDASNAYWTCSNGASVANCSRTKSAGTNGSCGSANGVTTSTAPSSGLCSSGFGGSSVVTNPSNFTWSCFGSAASTTNLAGNTANCSAPRSTPCVHNANNRVIIETREYGGDFGDGNTAYYIYYEEWRYNGSAVYVREIISAGAATGLQNKNFTSGSTSGYSSGTQIVDNYQPGYGSGEDYYRREWQICR